MYNRYIPQSDGSYRRNAVPEPKSPHPPIGRENRPKPCPPPEVPCREPEPKEKPCERRSRNTCPPPKPPPRREPPRQETGVGRFLRQLLPKDFDTSDLLVVILLLLMSGDCAEDQNTALLTLALYLFL